MLKYVQVLLICLVMITEGCTLSPQMQHAKAEHAQAERACVRQCELKSQQCAKRCHDSCKQCEWEASQTMKKHYKDYVHEQCVQGERVSLQLQSFRDPLKCRKISCDCPADYRICVGACKGTLRKYLQITPFCC